MTRGTKREVIEWVPAATAKPHTDRTVLCWCENEMFCGWWEKSEATWRACESGHTAEVDFWADIDGPHWNEKEKNA